ncbi:MAG: outer membrane protein assembly factor BamB [Sutterellaceae bacterium]|nr:outer membrane protein assembly factor BamB [Burkholderiaceae bacterium]MCX7901557.1 outer membrane protein assembly factor BamB [Burkholderiaceae bacterium]MDW8429064.1 outer membrane protein assembly factor BamB [Sutterellaceae bacterium]
MTIASARTAALLALPLTLAACSARDPAFSKPAELVEIKTPHPTRILWQVHIGRARGAVLQPAVVENAVYAAAADGTVARIAPDTGQQVWRIQLDLNVSAGVGSDGLRVVVASPRGEVLALAPDGKELWRARVSSDVTAPPLVGRGLVIVRSTDHRVAAFEAESGKRRWIYQRQTPPLALRAPTEMTFAGDTVLVGFPGGKLVALALANGAPRWELTVSEPKGTTEVERLADVVGQPAVEGGEVCAASFQGRLVCADVGSGNLRWARELSAVNGPTMTGTRVYAVDARSHVYAYWREGGAHAWRNEQLQNRALGAPLALPQAVAVGDFEGYVHFLREEDGGLLARVRVDGGAIVARPQRFADGLIVQTEGGEVALLRMDR